MTEIIDELRRINKSILFAFLCIISFLISYLTSEALFSNDLYYSFFGDQLTYEQITSFLEIQSKYKWIGYLLIPLIYLIKLFFLTIVLLSGTIFWNIKISFKKIFQIALIAEFIFLVPYIIKLIWFLYFDTDYELTYLQSFYPLSLINLRDVHNTPQWLFYPLQVINVFEIIYWLVLAYGISLVTREKFPRMIGVVASSYGVALLVWIVFITFLTINIS